MLDFLTKSFFFKPHGVRLRSGAQVSEGRVEIKLRDAWGTICDDHWTLKEANVVCRSLGYGSAAMATTNAYFGRGIGKVYSRSFFTDVTLVDFNFISMQIIPFLLLNLYGRWSFDRKPSIRCKECCVRISKGHKNKSFKFSCSYTRIT